MTQVTRNPNRGVELGYSEVASVVTSTNTVAPGNATACTITFVAGTRPVIIEAGSPLLQNSTAGSSSTLYVVDVTGGGSTIKTFANVFSTTANRGASAYCRARQALTPGTSYTYTLYLAASANTASSQSGTTGPLWLQATEV